MWEWSKLTQHSKVSEKNRFLGGYLVIIKNSVKVVNKTKAAFLKWDDFLALKMMKNNKSRLVGQASWFEAQNFGPNRRQSELFGDFIFSAKALFRSLFLIAYWNGKNTQLWLKLRQISNYFWNIFWTTLDEITRPKLKHNQIPKISDVKKQSIFKHFEFFLKHFQE